jgi:hypothetical protein
MAFGERKVVLERGTVGHRDARYDPQPTKVHPNGEVVNEHRRGDGLETGDSQSVKDPRADPPEIDLARTNHCRWARRESAPRPIAG